MLNGFLAASLSIICWKMHPELRLDSRNRKGVWKFLFIYLFSFFFFSFSSNTSNATCSRLSELSCYINIIINVHILFSSPKNYSELKANSMLNAIKKNVSDLCCSVHCLKDSDIDYKENENPWAYCRSSFCRLDKHISVKEMRLSVSISNILKVLNLQRNI